MNRVLRGCLLFGALGVAAVASGTPAGAAETITYKYDARGRLVRVVRTGVPAQDYKREYTYDRANNRRLKRTTPP